VDPNFFFSVEWWGGFSIGKKRREEQLLPNIEKLIVRQRHHFIYFNNMYEKCVLLSKIVVRMCECGEGEDEASLEWLFLHTSSGFVFSKRGRVSEIFFTYFTLYFLTLQTSGGLGSIPLPPFPL
jgi:hypothetical protein